MKPTIGRIVIYTLTERDADEINRRRTTGTHIRQRIEKNEANVTHWPIGVQAHIGVPASAGEEFPMIIVRVMGDAVNGQVLLDGNDSLWVTSKVKGDWQWPTRVIETTAEETSLESEATRDFSTPEQTSMSEAVNASTNVTEISEEHKKPQHKNKKRG